jgi:hypothetical protein
MGKEDYLIKSDSEPKKINPALIVLLKEIQNNKKLYSA